jgi:biopolymer transport protein ExbD
VSQPAPVPASTVAVPVLLLDLPRAEEWSGAQMVLGIALLAGGETTIDGQTVQTDADLVARMHEANGRHSDLRAVVRADASVPYGRVIHALDLLKQAGVERIAFAVTPVGSGAAPGPSTSAPGGGSTVRLRAGQSWGCAFPAAADAERVDDATVILVVAVAANGKPRWIRILQDPGYGFGQVAAECALARQYEPAHDGNGSPVQAMSPPIRIRFAR